MRSRGFSIPELLVALLLLGVVVQGGWSLLATFRRAAEAAQETGEALETARTVAWILGQELSGGGPETVWWEGSGDSLSLRAFRGMALVRGWTESGELVVCFRGLRNPAPEKDSLLVLAGDGRWQALNLMARRVGAGGCWDGAEGQEEVWAVEGGGEIRGLHLARLFERGSYHLAGGAFRYRSGGGGRQPLTVENLGSGRFFNPGAESWGIEWQISLNREGQGSQWRGRVR